MACELLEGSVDETLRERNETRLVIYISMPVNQKTLTDKGQKTSLFFRNKMTSLAKRNCL